MQKNPSDRRHGPCTSHPELPVVPAYTVISSMVRPAPTSLVLTRTGEIEPLQTKSTQQIRFLVSTACALDIAHLVLLVREPTRLNKYKNLYQCSSLSRTSLSSMYCPHHQGYGTPRGVGQV
jgi:hypothetical protein